MDKELLSMNPKVPDIVYNFDNMQTYGLIGQNKYGGVFFEEYEKDLQGIRGIRQYAEMYDGDDIIGAIFFAIEMLIRQVSWEVEPSGRKAIDRKAADFVKECLFDMELSWQDTLSEILSFLPFGWSYHEICYKRRMGNNKNRNLNSKYDDGLIGWRKLPIRAQETLWRWEYDQEDNLMGMSQMALPDYKIRTIPLEKALHFRVKSRKESPEGRSILRNAYSSYYFKKRFREIEGIGIERNLVGLPVMTPPEDVNLWDALDPDMVEAKRVAESIVRNIRRDESSGVVLSGGWKLELLSGAATQSMNVGAIIDRYDTRIAQTCLADFVMLGHQNSGSWSLSSDKTNLFSMAVNSFLNIICDTINKQGIERLIDLNGDNFKGISDYPRLVHGDLEDMSLAEFSTFLKDMVGISVIVPDETLEKHVRTLAHLPESTGGADYTKANSDKKDAEGTRKPQEATKEKTNINTSKNKESASEGDSMQMKKAAEFLQRIGRADNEPDNQV